ncbi:MAG: AI-2E family transporter [Patescibacteria group bacterium]|jgi:predicted PurR-regulated permease PerM
MKDQSPRVHVEISAKTIVFTIGFVILLYLLFQLQELFINLFLSFIFMSALKPSVDLLERLKLPRVIAALLVIVITISVLVGILTYTIPPLVREMTGFIIYIAQEGPRLLQQFNTQLHLQELIPLQSLTQYIPNVTTTITQAVFSVLLNTVNVVTVFFFTLYFLTGIKQVPLFFDRFLSKQQAISAKDTLAQLEKKLGSWVRGELVLMITIGAMTYIGLLILQVPYALPLAFIAGIFEVFPIIGPILSLIPVFFVAISVSLPLALMTIVMQTIIQQLENNLIVPFVMKQAVGIPPLAVLISLIVGGKLAGFSGVLLAIPFVAAATIFFQEILRYREKSNA